MILHKELILDIDLLRSIKLIVLHLKICVLQLIYPRPIVRLDFIKYIIKNS